MSGKIRLKIGGIEYAVTSDESEAYMLSLGAELEAKMQNISRKSPFLSTTMVAVMSAMESLDEAKKVAAENERLRLEMKRILEESAMVKLNAERARRRFAGGQTSLLDDEE